jgi:putative ABC transport system substrate-binding protein
MHNLTANGTFPGKGRSMQRRHFIALIGGTAVAWPLTAGAQQAAMPVVGYLGIRSPAADAQFTASFRQGLGEAGYIDGKNVIIEYRSAENDYGRLSGLAADLVHKNVTVIVAPSTPAALAAKAATSAIPIVFESGSDPVLIGLVDSLNRPGGNVTGATQMNITITPKRLELLHELLPNARIMALLVNPADPTIAAAQSSGVSTAAQSLGIELHVLTVSTERDFDAVFAKLSELRADGLVIGGGAFLLGRQKQLGELTLRHAIPAVSESRAFVSSGGLMGYGGSIADAYRLVGVYVGRILKGERPADLPVQQATKVELYINLKTAKALGITVPLPLSGRADELIE